MSGEKRLFMVNAAGARHFFAAIIEPGCSMEDMMNLAAKAFFSMMGYSVPVAGIIPVNRCISHQSVF